MPGAIPIDENNIKPLTDIAYQDSSGQWHAGPDNKKGLKEGQFISGDYAKRARAQRKSTNLIKANMRRREVSESEAREFVNKKRQELKDLKDAQGNIPEEDRDRARDIRKQIRGS